MADVLARRPYLTPTEAATFCGCSKRRLRTWVQRGILPLLEDADGRKHYHVNDLAAAMCCGLADEGSVEPVSTPHALPNERRPSRLRLTNPKKKSDEERR